MMPQLFVKFFLVFALWASTGMVMAQAQSVQPMGSSIIVSLRADNDFVVLEATQVGTGCVASHLSNFVLFRWDWGMGWQFLGISPTTEVGAMEAQRFLLNSFPSTTILHRFFVGSMLRHPTILLAVPGYSMSPGVTSDCRPVVLMDTAVLVVGTPEAFPFDYRGIGSFTQNVKATDEEIVFEVVGGKATEVLVVQEVNLPRGVTATWQRAFALPPGGGKITIPQHLMMRGVPADVLLKTSAGVVVRENLTTGTRRFVLGEDGNPEFLMERTDSPYRKLFEPPETK